METLIKGSDQAQSPNGADAGGVPPDVDPLTPTGGDGESPLGVVRSCQECGADMLDGQDWCLACGTAAPGRLGSRPGWRAVATVSALTLLLVMGAVAASYAALSQDANNQVAQTPPVTTTTPPPGAAVTPPVASAAVTPPAAAGPTTPATPLIPTTSSTASLPKLPLLPTVSTPLPAASTHTPTTTIHLPTTPTTPTTTTTASTPTTPTTPVLTPIVLGNNAAALYDPYNHAVSKTDPANSYDGKDTTSFSVTTDPVHPTMDLGLRFDLGSSKTVKQIVIHTTTPDFGLEIYGADGTLVPTDILDARWQHLRSRLHVDTKSAGGVANDGIEKINLKKPTSIRHLLLWFARPPKAGPTVTITEVIING